MLDTLSPLQEIQINPTALHGNQALTVAEALQSRRSIREFSYKAVDESLIHHVLQDALAAPSWGNIQPYRVAVATGDMCNIIRQSLGEKYRRANKVQNSSLLKKLLMIAKGGVLPDGDYKTLLKYPKELQQRYFDTGKGLYELLGIPRNDREGRLAQMARNFCFFDAPAVVFIFCEDSLGPYGPLDTGIFLQSLMLAAESKGLGTCAQASVATWASPIRKHFDVPKGYKLICGVSMGYAKDKPVNAYKPARRSLEDLMLKQG